MTSKDPGESPFRLNRTRIFMLVFFGAAALVITSTILATLRNMDEEEALMRSRATSVEQPAAAPAVPAAAQ